MPWQQAAAARSLTCTQQRQQKRCSAWWQEIKVQPPAEPQPQPGRKGRGRNDAHNRYKPGSNGVGESLQ